MYVCNMTQWQSMSPAQLVHTTPPPPPPPYEHNMHSEADTIVFIQGQALLWHLLIPISCQVS